MKRLATVVFFIGVTFSSTGQDLIPYRLFTEKGKKTTFEKLVKAAAASDVVLFGEYHDDAIAHWLQLELTKELYARDSNLVLGAEMFEADTQKYLDAYLSGAIDADVFADTVPSIWHNYKTDYSPLVDFAKVHGLHFVATNVPRYMASAVYRGGFEALDTLSAEKKQLVAPSPVPYDSNLPGYQAMLEMGGGHGGPKLPMAQAIKDATMGWNIVQNLPQDGVFLHFNGTYHSNNFEGIHWYLDEYKPTLDILTIATVRQEDLARLEEEDKGVADFILVVDADMTRTY